MDDYDPNIPPQPPRGERLLAELYASELADHAGSVGDIYELTPVAQAAYKAACYEAVQQLRTAAAILRQSPGCPSVKPQDYQWFLAMLVGMVVSFSAGLLAGYLLTF